MELNNRILDFLRIEPAIYEKSTKAFWDDEHISKGMLSAHLDADNDGASRKMTTIQKSVEWICDCCQDVKGKKLLDLGCGPGIYAELLNDKGFSVTGIDFSKRSIAYAQNHAKETDRNIEYHYQNYLEMDYCNKFDVITMIYCDFGVLSPDDRTILLKKIYNALKVDGVLILDAWNTPYLYQFKEFHSIAYEENSFWTSKPCAVIQKNKYYPETNNVLERYLVITEDACECYNIWNQIYSKSSFTEEICKQGFRSVSVYDDICGRSFTDSDVSICGVFSKSI